MPDLVLLGLAILAVVAFVPVAISWRRSRDGYIDQYLAGDPYGRLNYKMHLLLLGALPVSALILTLAAFAE